MAVSMNSPLSFISFPSIAISQRIQSLVFYSVIIALSILAAVTAFEVYHRYKLYKMIQINSNYLWLQTHTLTRSPVDDFFARLTEENPRGLFKINTTFDVTVIHPTHGTLNFSVRSNNVGFLSDRTYQFERNPSHPEYRIVVLGDSMTGPTTSTYQWVDTIEDLLNGNRELRDQVGGKEFRVYNLGWVGAGFQTFWKAYQKSGQYFSPDMVVVNFIEIDFNRTDGPSLKTDQEMIEHAKLYFGKLLDVNQNVLITLMPHFNDMLPRFVDFSLTHKLMMADPSIKVEIMRERLPIHLGPAEVESWFNAPYDFHYSDRGGEIYARALSAVIAERITGAKIDFSNAPSKYSNEVLGPGASRTRKIVNSLSRLAEDPAKVDAIKAYIRHEMFGGKVFILYPYSLNALLGLGTDGLTIPYTQPLKGGFVKVPFGRSQDDVLYLNVVCTSEPLSLHNPECYHHFHMYAR